jgi:CRISPR-associated protein Cmr5
MATTAKDSTPKSLEQRRAEHAWQLVRRVAQLPAEKQKDFARQALALGARVLTSGLGQTLAMLKAKGAALELRQALSDWILVKRRHPDGEAPENPDALLEAIMTGSAEFLRLATEEALAYAQWVARLTEGYRLGSGEESRTA